MLPNCVADPTFVFEESEFVVEEMAEPTEEATPILTRICWCLIHLRLTSERGKKLCPKEEEKVLPYDDAEGLLLSLWLPPQHLLELEEREHGDDDYNPISTGVPGVELVEEEAFALALKASMDSTLEERAAQIASLLFDDFPIFLQEDQL